MFYGMAEEENVLFDKTTKGLEWGIHYAGLRHKLIASNIANVDTPNYKALDISFRDQLEYLLETRGHGNTKMRSVSHSPPPPTLVQSPDLYSLWPRIDRNTVNIDKELAKLSQNTILHNTYLQLLKGKFDSLKEVIRESSR